MTVQFDYQLDLDSPTLVEVMAKFNPPAPEVQIDEFITDPLDGLEDARRGNAVDLNVRFKIGDSDPAETYAVVFTEICTLSVSPSKVRGVQTTADVSTSVRQRVSFEVVMALFATGASAQQQQVIRTAFAGLTAAGADIENFDVDLVVEQLAAQGINEELYHLGAFARVSRVGEPERTNPTTCEQIESAYPPRTGDERVEYPNPNTRPPSHVRAWCSLCYFSPEPPKPTSGSNIKEYDDIGSGLDIPRAVAEDIETVARELPIRIDCDINFTVVQRRLFTLFQYPEARLEPATKVISFRIFRKRIRIKIRYLQLQIRLTKIALMGFSRITAQNVPQEIVDQTIQCLIEAFVVSAISAFALSNPAAAAPVFQQWFIACMKRWAEELIECIAVGLFFAKENGQWNAV